MADVTKERDIWVHSFRMPPDSNNSIKMEVGIEDCLHIEFEYNKSKYVVLDFLVLLAAPFVLNSKLCLLSCRVVCAATNDQISPERCHRWQDLLPPGAHKDQAHGALDHPTRNNRCPTESVQRKRNDHKV